MGGTMKKKKETTSKKKKIMVAIVLLLLVLAVAAIILFFIKPGETKTTKEKAKTTYIKVPDVVGEESSTGQEILEKLGFKVHIKETEDDSKEDMIGKIYKQSAKGKVKKNTKITLSVYVSSEEIKMPNVIGMNKDEAKEILEKLGFNVTLEGKEDEGHPKDTVLSQKAANEDKIVRGSTIKLTYAKEKEEEEKEDSDKKDETKKEENDSKTDSSSPSKNETPNKKPSGGIDVGGAVDAIPDTKYTITISGQKEHRKGYGPYRLTANVSPPLPAGKRIVWETSNTSVATVSQDGYITPHATYGTARITARVEGTGSSGYMNIRVLGIKGDITGDGRVNSDDSAELMDFIRYGSNSVVNSVGDVDGDGVLTQADSDKIMNYYLNGRW